MFMLVTAITLWGLLFLGFPILTRPIPAHSITAFLVFSPFPVQGWPSWFLGILWLLWIIALLTLFINIFLRSRGPTYGVGGSNNLLSLGFVGNMQRLDTALIALAFLLAALAWLVGATPGLLFGSVIAFGLLGNKVEQSLV